MIFDSLLITFRILGVNKLRSILTILGITVGISAVIAIGSVGYGAKVVLTSSLNKQAGRFSIRRENYVKVKGTEKHIPNPHKEFMTMDDVEAIKANCPSVANAIPTDELGWRRMKSGERSKHSPVSLTTEEFASFENWSTIFGRHFNRSDMELLSKVVVIGFDVWQSLFHGKDVIGQELKFNNQRYTIIGVMEKTGQGEGYESKDNKVLLPMSTGKTYFGGNRVGPRNQVRSISIRPKSPDLLQQAQKEVEILIRRRHNDKPFYEIDSVEGTLKLVNNILFAVQLVTLLIAGFPLVIGGIGILNIMLVSVVERVPEIGLRKAVGAKPFQIRIQFLVEAVVISLIGSMLGLVFGLTAATFLGDILSQKMASQFDADWPSAFNPQSIFSGLMMGMLVGITFGFLPANQAARMTPIDAIRNK